MKITEVNEIKCSRCGKTLEEHEANTLAGCVLCEECYDEWDKENFEE